MTELFSISIMGMPERYSFIKEMLKHLPSRTQLVLDRKQQGCWQTSKRAWNSCGSSPYHMVLQDDILISNAFEEIVTNIINANPDHFISLFSLRSVHPKRDGHWATKNETTGQALIFPLALLRIWLNWVEEHCLDKPAGISDTDDLRMDLWMEMEEQKCWFAFPHIVQHVGTKSMLYGTTHVLPSPLYCEDAATLRAVDWTKGVDNPAQSHQHYDVEYRLLKPDYHFLIPKVR